MNKLPLYVLAAVIFGVSPVSAKIAVAGGVVPFMGGGAPSGCMTETASVNINFNSTEPEVSAVSNKMEQKKAELEKVLAASGLTKFELQSMNYSISPVYNGGGFQYSGNFSYTVSPSSKAALVMAELTKKGFQPSVNVNAYRNGGVPCPAAGAAPVEDQRIMKE